jgi:hypothetical protein
VVNAGKRSRREWLRQASRFALSLPLGVVAASDALAGSVWPHREAGSTALPGFPPQNPPPVSGISSLFSNDPTKYRFTLEEDRFLEQIERACFRFFWDEANA